MIRRPPRSTRTDTLFPYTTLFRSTLSRLSVRNGPGSRLRHWCSSQYLRISPLHWEFHYPLPLSSNARSEEHTSELQSLMRISYAVFCLKKKKISTIISEQHHKITSDYIHVNNINHHTHIYNTHIYIIYIFYDI